MLPAANKMFAQWCGDVLLKVLSSFNVWFRGTGRSFDKAPLQKHKRYRQCPWDGDVPNEKVSLTWSLIYPPVD